jgi:hypothetical protein
LTFADTAEKCEDGDSRHSQVAIIDLGMWPAERLHSNAAYSHCRPIGAAGGFLSERPVYPAT